MPPELLIAGVSLTVIVPGIVQGAKELGMPTKHAGLASVGSCAVVVGLVELQKNATFAGLATWAILSIVYGLAASGLYSQVKRVVSQ